MSRRQPPKSPSKNSRPPLPATGWPVGPRPPAHPQERRRKPAAPLRGRLSAQEGWSLLVLMVLPAFAVFRAADTVAPWMVGTWLAGISTVSWLAMGRDKKCAETGKWRTPESTLHTLEMLGGWPASYLAQRMYRHKIVKAPYQFTFWAIVVLHQAAAADYLAGWAAVRGLRTWLAG